jgi:predicted HTH transcriptional regulator
MAKLKKDSEALKDQQYIKRLIAEGEHQRLDFKFEISDSRKIAKTFASFANTDGGKLLLGVKDNGAITGVRSEEEYYMLEASASMYCKPGIQFDIKKWLIDGKTILEVNIPCNNEMVYAKDEKGKWLVYVRVADQNILANRVYVEVRKRKLKTKGTLVEYSKNENILLTFLAHNEEITLSKFTRISNLTRKEAENILINLLCFDVLKMRFTEKGAFYSLQ